MTQPLLVCDGGCGIKVLVLGGNMPDHGSGESPTIERTFELLDKWRHLPKFQLERASGVFFALYLPEVLGRCLDISINPLLVPEFPIKKALLHGGKDNHSINVDYLAVQKQKDGGLPKNAFLVELKTDKDSIDESQLCDLRKAESRGLECLVQGVIDICCSSTGQRRKYVHLLKLLSCLDLVGYDNALFPPKSGFRKLLKSKVEETKAWPDLKLVYVAPNKTKLLEECKVDTIDFNCFADAVENGDPDGIRHTFADHLRRWAQEVAGEPCPKDVRSC